MTEPKLTLFSDGLLSKWGFNDGDIPDEVWEYFDQIGFDPPDSFEWHGILIELVKRYLVPVLDQEVETVEICTNHNPIRAWNVNGESVEDKWYTVSWGDSVLTPAWVEVPMSEIAALTAEL